MKKKIELEVDQGSLGSYITGYILSLGFTVLAYLLVAERMLSNSILFTTIIVLATVQFIVQVIFFLHLNNEPKLRWNLLIFLFMVLVVFIIVIGTLWIMHNLDHNVMPTMK